MTTRLTSLNNWIEGEDKIMDTFKKLSNSLNFDVENQNVEIQQRINVLSTTCF
jgi:hypothetical protein